MESTPIVGSPVRRNLLARLAERLSLSPSKAIFLPTCIEVCARKTGWAEVRFIEEMFGNAELRSYIATAEGQQEIAKWEAAQ
jgi:hypothetical protein